MADFIPSADDTKIIWLTNLLRAPRLNRGLLAMLPIVCALALCGCSRESATEKKLKVENAQLSQKLEEAVAEMKTAKAATAKTKADLTETLTKTQAELAQAKTDTAEAKLSLKNKTASPEQPMAAKTQPHKDVPKSHFGWMPQSAEEKAFEAGVYRRKDKEPIRGQLVGVQGTGITIRTEDGNFLPRLPFSGFNELQLAAEPKVKEFRDQIQQTAADTAASLQLTREFNAARAARAARAAAAGLVPPPPALEPSGGAGAPMVDSGGPIPAHKEGLLGQRKVTLEELKRILEDKTQAQVLRLLGRPTHTRKCSTHENTAFECMWSYHIINGQAAETGVWNELTGKYESLSIEFGPFVGSGVMRSSIR